MWKGGERIGEMAVAVSGNKMTVLHTQVVEKEEGKGFGKQLVSEMVRYARTNDLTVTVACPYVRVQFMRSKETYADIWNRDDD